MCCFVCVVITAGPELQVVSNLVRISTKRKTFYSAAGRPRCQVTPYVVNVVVLLVVGGTVSYIRVCHLIDAFLCIPCFITFAHPTPLRMLRVGLGWGVIYPPLQNDALVFREWF